MTGEQFVELCFDEKSVLKEFFSQNSCAEVGEIEATAFEYFMDNK